MSRPVTLSLEQGHTLLLKGPASIRATKGDVQCFAAPIQSDYWIAIEEPRQEPFYATDNSVLEIRRRPGSSWAIVPESTVPLAWNEAADIVKRQRGIYVIIGEVDSGKSSLCAFLANKCLEDGETVGVVDADVGQADIGPPTTLGSAVVNVPIIGLHRITADLSLFIGDTSPSSVPDKVVAAATRLKRSIASLADIVLVNTDGWLGEFNAIRHKALLLDEIQPDLVLGLGRSYETMESLLERVKVASLRLPSSSFARARSREERKKSRESGYRRFLEGSHKFGINQETRLRMFDHLEQAVFPVNQRFRGFVAGLLDQNEELLGLGRINQVASGKVVVETKTDETPTILEIGNIALSSKYDEVGTARYIE